MFQYNSKVGDVGLSIHYPRLLASQNLLAESAILPAGGHIFHIQDGMGLTVIANERVCGSHGCNRFRLKQSWNPGQKKEFCLSALERLG